jgi:hypothetical protein
MVDVNLDVPAVADLILGRWRSQILHAGVELGVFEQLPDGATHSAATLAGEIGADPALLYRLLRALASIGLLYEDAERRFAIAPGGRILRSDHPQSLRAMALHEEGAAIYAVWRHLPDLIRTGVQDGFRHEFGVGMFDYMAQDPKFAANFSAAMSSYSAREASLATTSGRRRRSATSAAAAAI